MNVATLIRELMEAGASPEVLAVVLRHVEPTSNEAEILAARRARDRDRKRRVRGQSEETSTDKPEEKAVEKGPPPQDKKKGLQTSKEKTHPLPTKTPVRATRFCPPDWRPSAGDMDVAARLGMSPDDVAFELEKMKDHQYRDAHSNWSAAFRNWIRRAKDDRKKRPATHESFRERDHGEVKTNYTTAFSALKKLANGEQS